MVAVGASRAINHQNVMSGNVRVFQFDGFGWNQLGNEIKGETDLDEFGSAISLSSDGQTLAVGAGRHGTTAGSDSGYVRLFIIIIII